MKEKPSVWFTPLHSAECFHVIAREVFHRKVSQSEADAVFDSLRRDRAAGLWLQTPMPENAFDLCAELARTHGPKIGMKTLDTLHVACALELKAERFWTFDERQAKLAKAAGFRTTS
jgi:predicted nucleic acid-binding protein